MRRTFREFRRLINFMDVLYYVGDMMYRKSLRYSAVTAAVSLLGFLGNLIPGVSTYPARVAIALPLVVGATTLSGGLLLKLIPNVIANRLINVAAAQDLDLMEDYRKSRQEQHLESLWERVFRFEWGVASAASRVHPHPVECPPEVCGDEGTTRDPAERGKRQFLARAEFALARAQPQARQRYYLGIDLRFLEDWRNGAFFDRSDNKLAEQFDASAALDAVKREVRYGRVAAMKDLPLRAACKFWFTMITRVMSMEVGAAVSELNRHYETDYFNAQVILWPGEDREPWLDQFPLGREEVREHRRQILDRVFGATDQDAQHMLDRMVLPSFWLATRLRVRYDPEYLDGSLGYDVLTDLAAMGIAPRRIEAFRSLGSRAVAQGRALEEVLRARRPDLLARPAAEALRAVRVAAHTDRSGLGRMLQECARRPADQARLAAQMDSILQAAVEDRGVCSARLLGLRLHHELTRLHCLGYQDLLHALRETGSEPGPDGANRRSKTAEAAMPAPHGRLGPAHRAIGGVKPSDLV